MNGKLLTKNAMIDTIPLSMKNELEEEYQTFLTNVKSWLKKHEDQFVLIKNQQIVGFYTSYEEALEQGLKRFGNVPFFIKVVKEKEEVHFFYQGVV